MWLAISHAACGKVGFDPQAPADSAVMHATPALIDSANGASSTSSDTIAIPPTAAGQFLVVGVVTYNTESVVSITDDAANAYTSAGVRAIITAGGATEIWFARNSQPGATQVVVTITGAGLEGWVAELSGIDASPISTRAADDQNTGPTVIAASVTTTAPDALVVSVGAIVSGATGVDAASPFVSLGIPNGDIAAFYIAPVPGSYGAVFDDRGSGLACSSTAAFPAELQ